MAAPAVAIAGVMVGVPQMQSTASAATASAAVTVEHTPAAATGAPATVTSGAETTAAVHTDRQAPSSTATLDTLTTADRTYSVVSGDTLASIADRFYGSYGDWQWLYQQNTTTVSNPDLIYPGQVLDVPYGAPASASQSSAPANSAPASSASTGGAAADSVSATTEASTVQTSGHSTTLSGTLSCSGLEQLWEDAGGTPSQAFMAAEIAMAESSGNQYAVSPTDDYGYWQINAVHGSMATFNPIGNAEAAVSISADGSNWTPWTTYTSGAYEGKC
jgi:LysM repeat protein